MTTTTTNTAHPLAEVLARLVNGEGLPHSESREFGEFSDLVGAHLRAGSPTERERLGVLALGLLIDAARAKIASDQVLRNFGRDAFGE